MGGDAVMSMHGSHVVAGDNFTFAMPETSIGFLTGTGMTCGDALAFGIAFAQVPWARHASLVQRLIGGEDLAAESAPAPASTLHPQSQSIERCFSAATLPAILANLDDAGHAGLDFARSAAHVIRSKSPSSLAIALRQMQFGAKLDIGEALRTEFRIVSCIARCHDFYGGRAL
jgi:enoyl-CoA hydratase